MRLIRKVLEGFNFIKQTIVPKGKDQLLVFFGFFTFYAIFSFLMFKKYGDLFLEEEILNYDVKYWMNVFSSKKVMILSHSVKHPFITQVFSPFILLALSTKAVSIKYVFLIMLFFNFIAALSINLIYKYCTILLNLSKIRGLLICLFFGFFAHVLLLSFIPETFQLTMFGLLVMVYYTTDNILNKTKIPTAVHVILFFYSAGVTITNSVKSGFLQLFQREDLKKKVRVILISGFFFLGVLVLFNALTYIGFSIFSEGRVLSSSHIVEFIGSVGDGVDFFHDLFADPILFHHNYPLWWKGFPTESFQYNTITPVIVTILFYLLVLVAIVVNIKRRSVLLLVGLFGIDIFIHVICGFGIMALSIYCLHWIFIFPLLVAWLYKSIENQKIKIGLDVFVVCMTIYFAFNNLSSIAELVL